MFIFRAFPHVLKTLDENVIKPAVAEHHPILLLPGLFRSSRILAQMQSANTPVPNEIHILKVIEGGDTSVPTILDSGGID